VTIGFALQLGASLRQPVNQRVYRSAASRLTMLDNFVVQQCQIMIIAEIVRQSMRFLVGFSHAFAHQRQEGFEFIGEVFHLLAPFVQVIATVLLRGGRHCTAAGSIGSLHGFYGIRPGRLRLG